MSALRHAPLARAINSPRTNELPTSWSLVISPSSHMNLSRAHWHWPLAWGALALTYFLTGRLCFAISALTGNVSGVLFIPAGLSLIASLFWGARVAPAVFIGEFAIGLSTGISFPGSLIMGAGNALESAIAGWWFRDLPKRRIEIDRLSDVVQLILASLLVLQPISTTFGMTALTITGGLPPDQLWASASAWYAANIFAQFLTAPVALVWARWPKPAVERSGELIALTVLTLLVGALGPGRWAIAGLPLPVALICTFPLLVWASVRFVPTVAVTLGSVLGLFAFDAVLSGGGPLRDAPVGDQMLYLNVFMGVCLATALFLASAMGQERRAETEQARLITELQEAAKQVKRLEEFVTFCAWTGRVRWQDRWVSVETFLQQRYGVNISHGISDEAVAMLLKDMPSSPQSGEKPTQS